MALNPLAGWVPIRVYWQQDQPMVDWARLGEMLFTNPFFEQTVDRALSHPATLLFRRQTAMDALQEYAEDSPGLRPTGFIFHMSRCGSTLISQMLASLPGNLVLSEARPIDTILRGHFRDPTISEEQRVKWLQRMVSALGQARSPEQKHLFIKFDCWHALALPLIQRAFPGVPWVFLYRQPVEVLMSQQNQRGSQMIPGVLDPALFGWTFPEAAGMGLQHYGARVLARICQAALASSEGGKDRLLNYRQLPGAVWPALLRSWGTDCSPAEVEQMFAASRFHAKNPALLFEDDTAAKNARATPEVRETAARWLDGIYQELEAQRLRRGFY
jgi:hypothetical protein